MSQTHAPGEWRKVLEHIPYSESFRIVDEGTIVAHGVNLKNAERIVLCCNAHDDLVAALNEILAMIPWKDWTDEDSAHYPWIEQARAALAKAGEI